MRITAVILLLILSLAAVFGRPNPGSKYDIDYNEFQAGDDDGIAIDKVPVRRNKKDELDSGKHEMLSTNRLGALRRYFEQHEW